MKTLYIYNTETKEVVCEIEARFPNTAEAYAEEAKYQDRAEQYAEEHYGDTDTYGWTYSPAFGSTDGLRRSSEAEIIDSERLAMAGY